MCVIINSHSFNANSIFVDKASTATESALLVSTATETLERLLRSHRRRPGDIELEVYEVRDRELKSHIHIIYYYYEVRDRELKSHGSRIERQILAIAQKAHTQQDVFVKGIGDGASHVKTAVSAAQQRMVALDKTTNTASLNNLQRIAKVAHTSFVSESEQRAKGMKKVASDANDVLEIMDRRFIDSLTPFESGGQWNVAELEAARARLSEIEADSAERTKQWSETADTEQIKHSQESQAISYHLYC